MTVKTFDQFITFSNEVFSLEEKSYWFNCLVCTLRTGNRPEGEAFDLALQIAEIGYRYVDLELFRGIQYWLTDSLSTTTLHLIWLLQHSQELLICSTLSAHIVERLDLSLVDAKAVVHLRVQQTLTGLLKITAKELASSFKCRNNLYNFFVLNYQTLRLSKSNGLTSRDI